MFLAATRRGMNVWGSQVTSTVALELHVSERFTCACSLYHNSKRESDSARSPRSLDDLHGCQCALQWMAFDAHGT